ncbi:MAG TPA: cell division protein ZapA [Gammaproteobacteria bacterium]|nr:cell division protein ZapA [Gammaproteobacteria bacterium]
MEKKCFEILGEKVTLNFPKKEEDRVYQSVALLERTLASVSHEKLPKLERVLLAALKLSDEIRSLRMSMEDRQAEFESWLDGIQQRIMYSLETNE